MFEDAVKPLLDVHRTAARKAVGPSSGSARMQPLPPVAQPSPAGTATDSSGVAYATAPENESEGVEPGGLELGDLSEGGEDWMDQLIDDGGQPLVQTRVNLNIKMTKGTPSIASSARSPMPEIKGQDKNKLIKAIENEKEEEKRRKAQEKRKAQAAKQKVVPPSSSTGTLTSPSEGEQPAPKIQARRKSRKSLRRERQ